MFASKGWSGTCPGGSVTDPKGPASGEFRVLRGGGWLFLNFNCRSADRSGNVPDYKFICRHLPEVLLGRLAIYHDLRKWDLRAVVARRMTDRNPQEPGFSIL